MVTERRFPTLPDAKTFFHAHSQRLLDRCTCGRTTPDRYALACVGTVRTGYWSKDDLWTYDEAKVQVLERQQAIQIMHLPATAFVYRCTMLVALDETNTFDYGLPTVQGYVYAR